MITCLSNNNLKVEKCYFIITITILHYTLDSTIEQQNNIHRSTTGPHKTSAVVEFYLERVEK